jgi:hypothetical protein
MKPILAKFDVVVQTFIEEHFTEKLDHGIYKFTADADKSYTTQFNVSEQSHPDRLSAVDDFELNFLDWYLRERFKAHILPDYERIMNDHILAEAMLFENKLFDKYIDRRNGIIEKQ